MTSAVLIEVRGVEAGLLVRDSRGRLRFYAAVAEAFRFEGQAFRSASDARRAVAGALGGRSGRAGL